MKVLIACEFSGIVRDAFLEREHDAWSCDLLPTEKIGPHIKGDVLEILDEGWDLMIAHPPCDHLAVSGARWFPEKRKDGRQQKAIDFFMSLVNAPIEKIAIENPVGIMSTIYRRPDQIVNPWQFGDSFQKRTCFWLKNLPPLESTKVVDKGEFITFKSGKKMPKWYSMLRADENRAKIRSRTFQGMATAMAEQWGEKKEETNEINEYISTCHKCGLTIKIEDSYSFYTFKGEWHDYHKRCWEDNSVNND